MLREINSLNGMANIHSDDRKQEKENEPSGINQFSIPN